MKQRPAIGVPYQRFLRSTRHLSGLLAIPATLSAALMGAASAQETSGAALATAIDPALVVTGGAMLFALGAAVWAIRVSMASRHASLSWSSKLATMEANLERSESVLAAHPGLVLVWDDAFDDIEKGWGKPRVLGGPAALAALLTFAEDDDPTAFLNPADALLRSLGDLPLEEDVPPEEVRKLKERVQELRAHGVSFSGSVLTKEGRSIEVDGRVAGDQVTLWLTDPAVRLAEDGGVLGKARDRAADLHGALNQLEKLPMACWRRGADLRLEWVNRAYVEMVEAISLEDVLENQIEIDPAFKALAERAKTEFARSSRRVIDDTVIVNIKGQRRVLRVVETPMHQTGESALGGLAVDISALDRAREDLRRHQGAHRNTLDHMPSAVAVFGASQQIEYYNQAFLDLWKLDDADLRVRPGHGEILDRLHHKGQLPEQGDFSDWKRGQLALYTENSGPDAIEGAVPDEIWNLPNGKTLRVARQRHPLGGVLVVFEDITEKLKLETQYNTQISVQRATLNNLAEGVAVFASDGSLRLFNAAFQKLWRLEAAKLSNLPDFDELAKSFGKFAPEASEHWRGLRQRITSFSLEDRTPVKGVELALNDGRTLAYATSPLPDGATLVTFLDVTDSREREKELKERNDWLETADRLKSKFVNHISYNLRNPLNTIIGFSEMLETEMFGPLNDRQKEYAANILSASNHLLDLINDIIDLAAIDAGKLDLEVVEMNVRETLDNVATYASLKAEDSQVKLKLNCPDDIGMIKADEKRIKQVLFNLLANAFTFTDSGGHVELGAARESDAIRIWVRDTGRGVSSDDQAKAFDRFESRGPGSGVGLGLSLVKSFVELHGGWVRLASKEGKGTMITLHLPVAGPSLKANEEQADGVRLVASNPVTEEKAAPATRKNSSMTAAE